MSPNSSGLLWDKAWIFPKRSITFDLERGKNFSRLMMSSSIEEAYSIAENAGLFKGGSLSYSLLLDLMAEFTMIIQSSGCFQDINVDTMKHFGSEYLVYVLLSLNHID